MAKKLEPIHPGEILREEFLKPLGLSANRLSLGLRIPQSQVWEIVNEQRGITPETALRLARYFDTTPEFWMNLQTRYELLVAEGKKLRRIEREVTPMSAAVHR